jgi:hypothetical protein
MSLRGPSLCFATGVRLLGRIIYWLAVIAVSIALLILLVLFFESRDDSDVGTNTPISDKRD